MKPGVGGSAILAAHGIAFGGCIWSGTAMADNVRSVYIHMNGLNDFIPEVVFSNISQAIELIKQYQDPHSTQDYSPVGGKPLKALHEAALQGTPGPGHAVHSYYGELRSRGGALLHPHRPCPPGSRVQGGCRVLGQYGGRGCRHP